MPARGSGEIFDLDRTPMASPRPALQRNGSSPARLNPDLEELNRIGIALFETRDVGGLVSLILAKAREITCADAASLYLLEHDPAARRE